MDSNQETAEAAKRRKHARRARAAQARELRLRRQRARRTATRQNAEAAAAAAQARADAAAQAARVQGAGPIAPPRAPSSPRPSAGQLFAELQVKQIPPKPGRTEYQLLQDRARQLGIKPINQKAGALRAAIAEREATKTE